MCHALVPIGLWILTVLGLGLGLGLGTLDLGLGLDNFPKCLQICRYKHIICIQTDAVDSTEISLQLEGTKSTYNLHLQVEFENPHPTFRLVCVTIVQPGITAFIPCQNLNFFPNPVPSLCNY